MKQEAKTKIQEYLKKNDELFENVGEDEKVEAGLVTVATNDKAVYTLKQVLNFCRKFMDFPPRTADLTLTWIQLPGFKHKTRGWIWQQQDGYFFVKCGGTTAHFIDRRFY